MENILRLSHIKKGESCVIKTIFSHPGMRRRLQEMGIVPGTLVKCMYKSPFGDPTAYLIRGTLVALREDDSENILVVPQKQR